VIRGILGSTIALAAGLAYAEGVPLLTPLASAPGPRSDGVTHVKVNQFALDARIITVELEGRQYRFVGGLTGPMNVTTYVSEGRNVVDTSDHWLGGLDGPYQDGANSMSLDRHNGKAVTGTIYLRGQRYELMPGGVLKKARPG
jgi:hypothetical protein